MKNKKIIICLVVAILLTALFSVNVFAADFELTGENKSADGDFVEVNLILSGAPNINSIAIRNVEYDKTKLELISGEWTNEVQCSIKTQLFEYEKAPDTMTIYFANRTDFNGIVATLKFRVLDKSESNCEYSFKAKAIYTDEQGELVKVEPIIVPGVITIACSHDDMAFVPAKDATCAAEGNIEHYTCTKCHKLFSDEAGENEIKDVSTPKDPDNHTGGTKVVGDFAPTCKDYGYTGDIVCAGCEAVLEKGEEIEPIDEHNEEVRDAKDATCKEEGYTGDTYCKDCGKKLKSGEKTPIDPTNHAHTEIRNVSAATCVSTGNSGDTYCTDCGALVTAGTVIAVNPNAHNYVNNVCTYCGNSRIVYRPVTYMYIDDYSHLASGLKERHVPDSMTKHTDGEYEWNYCLYCQHEYGKVPIVNVNVDDTVDIVVDDPVQSGDDETIPDAPVTEPEVNEPVQDTNPPTGIAIALLPMVLAAGAVALIKKK